MSKPIIHAQSSVRKWGGNLNDYEPIHSFMDSSKGSMADNRHRALTHNSWFLSNILERVKFSNSGPETSDHRFPTIINSDGRSVSVRDIGEQHCLEDYKFKFMPSAQDFLQEMEFLPWMQNGMGEVPSSHKRIDGKTILKTKKVEKEPTTENKENSPEPKVKPVLKNTGNVVFDGKFGRDRGTSMVLD